MIEIIDCGSQVTHNIGRRIREKEVLAEIRAFNDPGLPQGDLEGIIISGGPWSVYDEGSPSVDPALLSRSHPILGICYGQQLLAHLLGGRVAPSDTREYARTRIVVEKESPLFTGLPKEFDVWMSHGDSVEALPEGFEVVARTTNGHVAAIQNLERQLFGTQFHPEVDHTEHGRQILANFVELTGAQATWTLKAQHDSIVDYLREATEGKVGVGGISGGVDSTTGSIILHNVAGESYHPIFVDNGLLRMDEMAEVQVAVKPFIDNVLYIDAAQQFLQKLVGVTDPDLKRKIIGHEFIEVFSEAARDIPGAGYLFQGTLYPDVIESVPVYGATSKIKRHHNVGGLPDELGFDLVEPFRMLFKDEVRRVAEEYLGLPREMVWRHPFPGPGLAVRIIGEVTPEKVAILQEADKIFIDELRERGHYYDISQALAVLTGARTVGVMGDAHTYEGNVALRAVVTSDFMTAEPYQLPWRDLLAISDRIVNEVRGVNRVVYDTTSKPPGTIEWE